MSKDVWMTYNVVWCKLEYFSGMSNEEKLGRCNMCSVRKICKDFHGFEEVSHQQETYPRKPIQSQTVRNKVIFPERNGHCYYCGNLISDLRKNYCNDKCRENYAKFTYQFTWGGVCDIIFDRDNHTCQDCGKVAEKMVGKKKFYQGIILEYDYIDTSGFEIDHIKAWCLDGDLWDINNLQVLCLDCHRKKTVVDIGKLAIINREKKEKKRREELREKIKNKEGLWNYL